MSENFLSLKQDIQIDDITNYNDYKGFYNAGQYNEAISLINTNISSLGTKVSNQDLYNSITDLLTLVQNLYYNNVEDELDNLFNIFEGNVNNYNYKGLYTIGASYNPLNFVSDNNNLIYICLKSNIGTDNGLNNAENWLLLGLKGEKGIYGFNCVYKNVWSSSITYSVNDLVYYDNILYYSKQTSNINNEPNITSEWWGVFFTFEATNIKLYTEPSNNYYNNETFLLVKGDD